MDHLTKQKLPVIFNFKSFLKQEAPVSVFVLILRKL